MAQQLKINDDRSLGDLFTELASETGSLVRQEVSLAQAELTHKATKAGKSIAYVVVGGAVGYAALLAMLTAVILLLSHVMPAWLAALLVSLIVGGVSYFLVTSALAELKNIDPVPRETVETIKEDAKWIKNEVS